MTALELDEGLIETLQTTVVWGDFDGIPELIEKLAFDWTSQFLGTAP